MKNNPDFLLPDWPAPKNVRGLSTLRYGGVSAFPYHGKNPSDGGFNLAMHVRDLPAHVEKNRNVFRQHLPKEPLWLNQVHGTSVANAAIESGMPDADASFSTRPHDVCLIQTADCLPVLFCDTAGRVVAAAHAGWRGLAHGVLENTLQKMRESGAGDILAWLGPAIGPEQFEVGEDVLAAFAAHHENVEGCFRPIADVPGKYLADIYGLARIILAKNHVAHVYGGGFCTVSDPASFYSYRRDGVTGRMATCIWLT